MLLLCNGSFINQKIIAPYPELHQFYGWLNTPRNNMCFQKLSQSGFPIAIDNSAFSDFNASRFRSIVKRAPQSVLWVTVPDVVGNADATLRLFGQWEKEIPQPKAFVSQDGADKTTIPYNDFDCLFIGGTDDWKLSEKSFKIVKEAKRRGKWLHMGRVNSFYRMRIAYDWGCDSVDGTGYSQYSKKYLLPALRFLDGLHRQGTFL